MVDVLSCFLASVEAHPDHPALDGDTRLSYAELAERVRRLAGAIRTAAGEGPRVLVHLPQGADAYAAMLATRFAGGFYAPTNVTAPVGKQRRVLERFEPDVVVTLESLWREVRVGCNDVPVVDVGRIEGRPLDSPLPPHEIAYVIFTSGSTGEPKGVEIPASALDHYAAWSRGAMRAGPGDRWSQHPNIGFDLSVLDVYGALTSGATLVPLTGPRDRLMPADAIRRHGLTIWNSVPSVVDLMLQAGQLTATHLASLRLMTFCGEPLLPAHLEGIFTARPDLTVHNTYGPTEATVSCTLVRLDADSFQAACGASVALGDTIPGTEIHLIGNESDEGEIAITGIQLARGYWRDPELTASRFRVLEDTGERAYFTGDRAQRRDGRLFFQGRGDSQVKIRGHRLELGEVEAALRTLGFAASVQLIEGDLHCFVEGRGESLDVEDLRSRLGGTLEQHAVPKHFHVIAGLPRNVNDKVDARALVDSVARGEK